MGQAGNESRPDGISTVCHDDGNGCGKAPGCESCWCGLRDDHVHLDANQRRCKFRQQISSPACPAIVDHEVLALNVSQLAQRLPEGFNVRIWRSPGQKEPDPMDLRRRLRLGSG